MKTLIIGSGPCAFNIAVEFIESGNEIILASREPTQPQGASYAGKIDPAHIITDAIIVSCRGGAGDFTVRMATGGKTLSIKASSIVISEENEKKPNFVTYGLKPAHGIVSLSSLAVNGKLVNASVKKICHDGKIVFLTGIGYESNPLSTEEIMLAAMTLQKDRNLQTYILTGNLKVAGKDLEKLYRETKKAGAVYFKFTNTSPLIMQDDDGKTVIELADEITGLDFKIKPDLTVVDETLSPSLYMNELADVFGLHTGADGFLQTENIHRAGVYTNRRGIFVAGPSRSLLKAGDCLTDSANSAILAYGIENGGNKPEAKAAIKSGLCVRCLTCLRCCPYRAIELNAKPSVIPGACEGCGICSAECPRGAIFLDFPDKRDISDVIRQNRGDIKSSPAIVAFCCRRSAARAKELALSMGYSLCDNLKVVEVPCSGFVSVEHILSAFRNNADGVLLLTCHEGNCHSEKGNLFAKRRVELLKDAFSQMNFDNERLEIRTMASNMGREFANIAGEFENKLKTLGPQGLKKER
jgi:coenzyme F420-reducing hydrogenase delta subunit/Pyruvate/2-oxoacid:ferredoxin oxidoreductase delta subunit